MNLCLDIGNSKIRAGLFSGSRLVAGKVFYLDGDSGWKELRVFLSDLNPRHPVERAGLISVSPPLTKMVSKAAQELTGVRPRVITHADFKQSGINYRNPAKLGMDRLINAYAAYRIYGGPALVVDIGTAVTCDMVDAKGGFRGGAIAPGPGTMARSLHEYTAVLPLVGIRRRPRATGIDTPGCIASGLYWGTVGMVRELIDRISRGGRNSPRLIFTGGWGALFAGEFRGARCDELLTVKGIDLFLGASVPGDGRK